MKSIIKANAKLNLSLLYTEKRPDGFLSVNSVMAFCTLANEISISLGKELSVEFEDHVSKDVYIDPKVNTITKCIKLIEEAFNISCPFDIFVKKGVPTGAGLGSGSADAAAVARFVCSQYNLDSQKVYNLCRNVGMDVSPCFFNQLCFVAGLGEKVSTLNLGMPECFVLLVNPGKSVLTGEVYKLYAKSSPTFARETSLEELEKKKWEGFIKSYADNHLLPVSSLLVPEINSLLDFLREQMGVVFAQMSGSGATCFALFESEKDARESLQNLKLKFPDYWSVLTELI